ncbi:MAG TPA: amidohydrolase, partial [Negativicutes bacterium]|nr:amidohydrolase [Negativicutes bacterium]
PMIEAGVLDGVDAIIGAHLWQPIEAGKLGITYGHMMSEPGSWNLTVKGKGGHGSMPHQTVDSILVSAQIIQALHTIVSRNVDPLDTAVLSIGMFKAGHIRNIIPDSARMEGTVRVFEHDLLLKILARIDQTAKGICEGHGAEYVFETIFSYPAVTNNPAIVKFVREAGEEVLGKDGVEEIKPVLAAEDFSRYLQKVPGAFMFVGCGNAAEGKVYPHHHPKFDIDEAALANGVEIMVRTVLNYLKGPAK